MTLPETLLPRLSEWRPAGAGRHSWSETFPAAGWTVQVAADKADSLSCLVWELALTRTADAPTGSDESPTPRSSALQPRCAGLTLANWAVEIAARVTGLMEPLKVHEVDETRGEAVLRSIAPAKKGEALAYYEVRLHGLTNAVVRRYTASKAEPGRAQVAFALTHETIAKLVGDIAG